MSMREHPGRFSTKSAPNAWNGVTRPSATGSELILDDLLQPMQICCYFFGREFSNQGKRRAS